MAKYNFNLRDPNSKSNTPINLIVRYNGIRLVYSTKESINPKYWQKDRNKRNFQRAKETRDFPEYPEFNAGLDLFESKVKSVFRRLTNDNNHNTPSKHELKEALDKEFDRNTNTIPNNLFDFIEYFIQKSKTRVNPDSGKTISEHTIKKYKTSLTHLRDFQKKINKPINFKNIDYDFYTGFVEYLTHDLNLAVNSVGKDIRTLITFLNEATLQGVNHFHFYKNTKLFKVPYEDSDTIYLNSKQLDQIYKVDLSKNKGLDRVRDLFLIAAHTGLRFGDFSNLSKVDHRNNRLYIKTKKSKEPVILPLKKVLKEIFIKYGNELPNGISNQKTNIYLKDILKKIPELHVEISKSITKGGKLITEKIPIYNLVTTHTARRSMATNLYLEGFPPISIMAITGHKTESSFMKYIKITKEEVANSLEDHWKNTQNG